MAVQGAQDALRGQGTDMRNLLMTPRNVARITTELARMRGAAMKLGQLISMDAGEVLPPELAQMMARLRAQADFMPPAQLKKVLTDAWGADWLKRFAHFNVRPIAAASIGQVHRARLKDGRDVAIKVQYPGIAHSIDSDVSNVAALVKLSGLVPKGFDIAAYVEEARRQLHEETDYLQEASHLERFQHLLAGSDRYVLPEVHRDLTTRSILTMSYVESDPLEACAALDAETRNQVATDLIDLVLAELFEFGLVQSDPNFANFRVTPDTRQLVLLDFGATRQLYRRVTSAYQDLIRAGLAVDTKNLQASAKRLGLWDDATPPHHVTTLTHMMDQVFASIAQDPIYDFADQTLTNRLNEQALDLAKSGFVPPPGPMDAPFIQRKLAGTFLIAANLQAKVPLQSLLQRRLDLD